MNESTINSRALALSIRSAWGAASKDATRPQLQSVQIVARDGIVSVHATDGCRAHRVTFAGGVNLNFSRLFLIAKRIGKNALATVSDDGATLTLADGATVTTVLAFDASMQYPRIEAVIPKPRASACEGPVGISADLVASACDSAAMVASDKKSGVRLLIGASALDPIQIDADSAEFAALNFAFKALIMPMRL